MELSARQTTFEEIESWREMLARHLAHHNKNLTQRELNFAVQMTIDRIIFLRRSRRKAERRIRAEDTGANQSQSI